MWFVGLVVFAEGGGEVFMTIESTVVRSILSEMN